MKLLGTQVLGRHFIYCRYEVYKYAQTFLIINRHKFIRVEFNCKFRTMYISFKISIENNSSCNPYN